ncbi:TWiK family of potassium channels protein 18-like [Penaeus indicus]|uniref:TWiK family of potassium channels protein 18-like n=1 Tax=Penaeus indicus TaxID=29960 RepID=UPI00300D5A93
MQTAYARMVYDRHQQRLHRRDDVEVTRATTIKHWLKDACRKLIAFMFTQVGVCGLVVAYNIVGAFAFRAIEGDHGDGTPEELARDLRETLVGRLWNVTLRLNVLEEDQWRKEVVGALEEYQGSVVPLVKTKGYRGVHPTEAWSFSASLMYSLSVYTTIGYGNMTPRTEWGKITTILYAIVGMPLMLLYMSNVGEILAKAFKFLYFRACRYNRPKRVVDTDLGALAYYNLAKRAEDKDKEHKLDTDIKRYMARCDIGSLGYYRSASGTIRPVTASPSRGNGVKTSSGEKPRPRTIPITWCLLVIAIYVFCGGLVFSQWERWSLLDACYFAYISLSTIGFGDLSYKEVA